MAPGRSKSLSRSRQRRRLIGERCGRIPRRMPGVRPHRKHSRIPQPDQHPLHHLRLTSPHRLIGACTPRNPPRPILRRNHLIPAQPPQILALRINTTERTQRFLQILEPMLPHPAPRRIHRKPAPLDRRPRNIRQLTPQFLPFALADLRPSASGRVLQNSLPFSDAWWHGW